MSSKEQVEEMWAEIETAIREHPADDLILTIHPVTYRDFYRIDMLFRDRVIDRKTHTWIRGRISAGRGLDKEVEVIKDLSIEGWALEARE